MENIGRDLEGESATTELNRRFAGRMEQWDYGCGLRYVYMMVEGGVGIGDTPEDAIRAAETDFLCRR